MLPIMFSLAFSDRAQFQVRVGRCEFYTLNALSASLIKRAGNGQWFQVVGGNPQEESRRMHPNAMR